MADAKTGGRVRSTRQAISTQKDALGPAFAPRPSPKTATSSPHPPKPKRASTVDSPYSSPKRVRRGLVQPVVNGHTTKSHPRKAADEKIVQLSNTYNISTSRSPRIKVKYKAPEPLITHPLHIPPPKSFPSLTDYLDSFVTLDDNEDLTLEKAEAKAIQEAAIRDRIAAAKARGWLASDSNSPNVPRKQTEPSTIQTRHDIMLKHVLNFSGLMAQERRSNLSRAKKIAQMVSQHFRKLEGTDEKELKEQERKIRRLAKWTAQEVRKKWKLAEKVLIYKLLSLC